MNRFKFMLNSLFMMTVLASSAHASVPLSGSETTVIMVLLGTGLIGIVGLGKIKKS